MTYSVLFRLREYWFQDKNKLTSVVLVAAVESLKAARSGHFKGRRQGGVYQENQRKLQLGHSDILLLLVRKTVKTIETKSRHEKAKNETKTKK